MSLKLRPTGLGSGAGKDKDDPDFVVSAKANRRIYERRGLPDDVRWSWSLYGVVRTRPSDNIARMLAHPSAQPVMTRLPA